MIYRLHKDGSFDIAGSYLELCQACPAIDGQPVRTQAVTVTEDTITYQLEQAALRLQFSIMEGRVEIRTSLKGLAGIHDVEIMRDARIIDAAVVKSYKQQSDARQVFVQGYGMEGPSGIYTLSGQTADPAALMTVQTAVRMKEEPSGRIPDSHGITAIGGAHGYLFAYTTDHRRYSTCFSTGKTSSFFDQKQTFSCAVNLEGITTDQQELPCIYFKEDPDLAAGLRSCAGEIALQMQARNVMPPAFHWCSWYYLYQNLDQAALEEYCESFSKEENIPFKYIQIDAGYCPSRGDWLTPNHLFPGGLKEAAATVIDAGYQPGIWIAPFMVGDRSELIKDHPDWILTDLQGRRISMIESYTEPKVWGNPDSNYYILDASHPDALAYLKKVFETFRAWGFTLFKTDFMMWNMQDTSKVRRYDSNLTSVEIMRNVLKVIREAIGDDSYLLGCIAPYMPFIGYADGMRIAGDVGAQWAETFGPVNLLQEIPADNYFQNIFWQNDPDSVLLRDFETGLTAEETRSLALLQAISGGCITTSDPVHLMGEDRKAILKMIRPDGKVTPEFPFLTEKHDELTMLHRLEQGNLLYILNPTDREIPVMYELEKLLGEKEWYQYRFNWDEDAAVSSIKSDLFLERIAPHNSVLLFITKEPLTARPSNLWKW